MTKRFSAIWALAATLLLLASCGEKLPDPAIDIPTTEDLAPAFTRDGGSTTDAYASTDGKRYNETEYHTVWKYDGIYPVSAKTPEGTVYNFTWQNNGMPAKYEKVGEDPVVYMENPRYVVPNAFGVTRFNDYWDLTFKGTQDGNYKEEFSEYKYDARGNWTSLRGTYKNGDQNGGSEYLREVTYY